MSNAHSLAMKPLKQVKSAPNIVSRKSLVLSAGEDEEHHISQHQSSDSEEEPHPALQTARQSLAAGSNSSLNQKEEIELNLQDEGEDLDEHHLIDRDQVHGLVHVDPTYKHRPLSPTPVDSYMSDDQHSVIEPLKPSKSHSFLAVPAALNSFSQSHHGHHGHVDRHHSNPIPALHPTQNLSTKQFYEYIESIVIRHVNQSNAAINHHKPINMLLIKRTLSNLKTLLLSESDTISHLSDEDLKLHHHSAGDSGDLQHYSHHTLPHKTTPSMQVITESNGALNNGKYNEDVFTPNGRLKNGGNHGKDSVIKPLSKKSKWCTHSTRSLWTVLVPSSALIHHPSYSINVNKYYGKLRGSVRQDWNTIETDDDEERNWEELKPHWFELFFDLMFVAAIVHISTEVADAYHHHDYLFIFTVFPQFGLLILCWLEQVLYQSRFRMTQTWDEFLRFIYMALVLLMGLSITNNNSQTSQKLFLFSYLLTRVAMLLMFLKSALIPRARGHSIYMMIENIISLITCICIEVLINVPATEYEKNEWVWTVVYSVLFVYSWLHTVVIVYAKPIRDLGINIPINVPHVAERLGAFVLIILGETIISIMVQHIAAQRNAIITSYSVTMSFFLIVYCIGKLYFESQPTEYEVHHHRKVHAMSASVNRARIFKWFHILLFFGLLGLGLGSKITIHELPEYHAEKIFVWLPGISCIVICLCINAIRLTHPFDYTATKKHPHLVIGVWVLRVLCIALMVGMLFTWDKTNHAVVLAIFVLCFLVQIFIDFEAKHRLFVTKKGDKEKSLGFYKQPQAAIRVTATHAMMDHHGHDHHDDDHPALDDHNLSGSHLKTGREMTATREMSFIGAF